MKHSENLGTMPIGKLLIRQSLPAAAGFLVMSVYQLTDTIYVGHWIGKIAIGAITVVMPIVFMVASFGMAVGIGGGSIISRALGKKHVKEAEQTLGNMFFLISAILTLLALVSYLLLDQVIYLFGAQGDLVHYAKTYMSIILPGIPLLGASMMLNNALRAEGKARIAMMIMVVPAAMNIILDPIFIFVFNMGLAGAAWATLLSYIIGFGYAISHYIFDKTEVAFHLGYFRPVYSIIKSISGIGVITLARQGTISILYIVLNHTLFTYGKEDAVAIYGIISRVMMFIFFPMMGIMQGFMPIVGYNYGAGNFKRVEYSIRKALIFGSVVATILLLLVVLYPSSIAHAFTNDDLLIKNTAFALVIIFLTLPVMIIQLISSAYFQSIGKPWPALWLTLSKQGFLLIPLVLIFPIFWDLNGIWYAFPSADLLAAVICGWYLHREVVGKIRPAAINHISST